MFCELKTERPGELPYSLREFRNNPPATQRLLLKRPATNAGKPLPGAPTAPPATAAPPPVSAPAPAPAPAAPEPAPVESVASNGLGGCRLTAEAIACPHGRFTRQRNGATHHPPDALRLAPLTAASRPDGYAAYLEAMLALGLGEEAMSYTKFSHFAELQPDYHQRLDTMYQALRRDRERLGAPARRPGGPPDLDACFQLTAALIVCDDVNTTWLFAR